jgi:hypothetical protein
MSDEQPDERFTANGQWAKFAALRQWAIDTLPTGLEQAKQVLGLIEDYVELDEAIESLYIERDCMEENLEEIEKECSELKNKNKRLMGMLPERVKAAILQAKQGLL